MTSKSIKCLENKDGCTKYALGWFMGKHVCPSCNAKLSEDLKSAIEEVRQ